MSLLHRKVKRSKAVLVALAAVVTVGLLAPTSSVGADPKFADSLVGSGSDTTMDVMAGLSGFANGKAFTPVQSSVGSGSKHISSWDSKLASHSDNCIAPKLKAPTVYRPNGSSEGRRALSRAIDGTVYGPVDQCGGSKVVTGLFDYARSSSGPSSGDTGTALTYIPFGRDALAVAYYANGVANPVTDFTRAQITTLFTTGPQVIDGVEVIPCGIQTGSGTYQSWLGMTTATADQDASSTATCSAAGTTTGRIQENDGAALKMKGDALVGKQVIIGFSAGNFIAQGNGVALSQLAPGIDLGTISNDGTGADLGAAYTTAVVDTRTVYSPAPAFYASTVFGRNVYNVFDTARVTGFGNNDVKSLFVGPTSAVCSVEGQVTVNQFGFSTIATCGSITLTGSLITGIK
jgi:ABC-type phosphate transport system substrate-binding protein